VDPGRIGANESNKLGGLQGVYEKLMLPVRFYHLSCLSCPVLSPSHLSPGPLRGTNTARTHMCTGWWRQRRDCAFTYEVMRNVQSKDGKKPNLSVFGQGGMFGPGGKYGFKFEPPPEYAKAESAPAKAEAETKVAK
jgi:hypothetical protein